MGKLVTRSGGTGALGTTVEVGEIETLAKGALIVGDGSGAPSVEVVGVDNKVLTADATKSRGVDWKVPFGGTDAVAAIHAQAPYEVVRRDEFTSDAGGWTNNVGSAGTITAAGGKLVTNQTADFAVPMVLLNTVLTDLPELRRCGRLSIAARVTLDPDQGTGLDTSANTVGVGFSGEGVGGTIFTAVQSIGDGVGDADVQVFLIDPAGPTTTPVALGKLSALPANLFIRFEILATSATAFTAIGYCAGEGLELREVGRLENLVQADYGYEVGIIPFLISQGDTETTPHEHKHDDVTVTVEAAEPSAAAAVDLLQIQVFQ